MTQPSANPVLRRMIDAAVAKGRGQPATTPGPKPEVALANAFSRMGQSRLDMVVQVTEIALRTGSQSEVLELLPEQGLLAVLDGPREAPGLMALDVALVSGLVEQQTMGRLRTTAPEPRLPTRIDAALMADIIDEALHGLALSLSGWPDAQWASDYGYASFLIDRRPLALVLEDEDYRIFTFELDLAEGTRQGKGLLALPANGSADADTEDVPSPSVLPAGWAESLHQNVMAGSVSLDAVLIRLDMSIARVRGLHVDQVIPLPVIALEEVSLETSCGRSVASCLLGQSLGMRAVRVHDPATVAAQGNGQGEPGAEDVAADFQGAQSAGKGVTLPPPALGMPLVSAQDLPSIEELNGGGLDLEEGAMPELPDIPDLPDASETEEGSLDAIGELPSLDGLPDMNTLPDIDDLIPPEDGPGLPSIEGLP